MSSLLAALVISSQASAPPPTDPALRWLNCSEMESSGGRLFRDRLAYVFFDAGSAVITPPGAAMLDSFVVQYDQPVPGPLCTVTIGGSADRVGSDEHNLLLSRRRAAAVAAYLRSKGLSAPLRIEAYGESRLLVDTADGVPDAQNRYVVVVVGE